jgi:hypothetical protein
LTLPAIQNPKSKIQNPNPLPLSGIDGIAGMQAFGARDDDRRAGRDSGEDLHRVVRLDT